MTDPRPPSADDEHDAWLHQALRHAPDAGAAAPGALRETILAEARSALRARPGGVAASSLTTRLAAFWAWLGRPPVAAGFASVMVATLVGLVWWDRPMDESMPMAPPTAPVTKPSAAPTQEAAAPPTPAEPLFKPRREVAETKDRAAAKTAGARRSTTHELAKSADANRAPGDTDMAGPARAPAARNSVGAVAQARSEEARPEEARPEEARSEQTREQAREQRAAPDAAARDAVAGLTPAPQAFATPPASLGAASRKPDDAEVGARPLATLLAAIARDPQRWGRATANGEVAAIDAANDAWLADVERATAGRWLDADARATRLDEALVADGRTLRLRRDGRAAALVQIDATGVFFEMQPGGRRFAPLPAAALARLRASLPPAAR